MNERKIVQVFKVENCGEELRYMAVLANDGTIWEYVCGKKDGCWVIVDLDPLPQPEPDAAPRLEGYDPAFMPAGASLATHHYDRLNGKWEVMPTTRDGSQAQTQQKRAEPRATSELNTSERASVGSTAPETAEIRPEKGFWQHGQYPHPSWDRATTLQPEILAYTIPEAVRVSGLSRSKIYTLIQSGKLKTNAATGRTLIIGNSLRALLSGDNAQ